MRALKGAERFIYIENQFLWSPEIEAVLHDKIIEPPAPRLPALAAAPVKAEHRRRRHARRARPLDRSRRRRRPASRLHALRTRRPPPRPRLHPRKGRDHRRQLAHPWLRQSQRALALQRHRDEHRQPRPRARPGDEAAPLGRASRMSDRRASPPTRSKRSTTSGSRSARISSSAETPAVRSPIVSSGCRTCRAVPVARSARSQASWSTGSRATGGGAPSELRAGVGRYAVGHPPRPEQSPSLAGGVSDGSARSPRECGSSVRPTDPSRAST